MILFSAEIAVLTLVVWNLRRDASEGKLEHNDHQMLSLISVYFLNSKVNHKIKAQRTKIWYIKLYDETCIIFVQNFKHCRWWWSWCWVHQDSRKWCQLLWLPWSSTYQSSIQRRRRTWSERGRHCDIACGCGPCTRCDLGTTAAY